jgi:hypothetical protein
LNFVIFKLSLIFSETGREMEGVSTCQVANGGDALQV